MRVLGFKALADDSGQSSVDFIFGFGVFLLTFIFAISFVAGLFTPFQPGAIDLSSVAYRTCALLVEDPGWYIGADGNPSGTALWETYYQPGNLTLLEMPGSGLRIGLANNKSTPNMISIDKINAFKALASDNYTVARDRMGLNGSTVYNFNVSIVANMTIPTNGSVDNNVTLLNVTSPTPPNNNVELLDRKVMVDMGKQLFINCSAANGGMGNSMQWINLTKLTGNDDKNIIIRVYDTAPGIKIDDVGWSSSGGVAGIDLVYSDEYLVYLNGVPVSNFASTGVTLNQGDILEIVVFNSFFKDPMGNQDPNKKYIYLHSSNGSPFPGPMDSIGYFDDPTYHLIDVYYPATLHLELWSYGFS